MKDSRYEIKSFQLYFSLEFRRFPRFLFSSRALMSYGKLFNWRLIYSFRQNFGMSIYFNLKIEVFIKDSDLFRFFRNFSLCQESNHGSASEMTNEYAKEVLTSNDVNN